MKIRQGFVSNSSSSSFIVAVPTGTELTADAIMTIFAVPEHSPVYGLNYEIADFIACASQQTTAESILRDWGYDSIEDALEDGSCDEVEIAVKYAGKGFDVYRFSAADDNGNGIENMLCDLRIDIHTDNFALVGGGGY